MNGRRTIECIARRFGVGFGLLFVLAWTPGAVQAQVVRDSAPVVTLLSAPETRAEGRERLAALVRVLTPEEGALWTRLYAIDERLSAEGIRLAGEAILEAETEAAAPTALLPTALAALEAFAREALASEALAREATVREAPVGAAAADSADSAGGPLYPLEAPGLAALAARLLDAAWPVIALELRLGLLAHWPEAPEVPETMLAVARARLAEADTSEAAAARARGDAIEWLERILIEHPDHPLTPEARRLLGTLRVSSVPRAPSASSAPSAPGVLHA